MADLGRAALVVSLGLALYALVAGTAAAVSSRRRLADSARNALIACFGSTARRRGRPRVRARAARLLLRLRRRAHEPRRCRASTRSPAFWGGQEGSLLLWLLVLTGYGALAVAVNRRLRRDLIAVGRAGARRHRDLLRLMLVAVSSPFATQARAARRRGPDPEPPEPVHGRATRRCSTSATSGSPIPFAFAAGALLSGRTDERWIVATRRWTLARLDVPRHRPAARLALGLRRGRLGRLLRLGPGRERRADAVARRDGVPALGDGPGAQGDAEGLEHRARRARVRALDLRHVPDPFGGDQLDPLVREELDRAVVPDVRDPRGRRCLTRADPLAAAAAPREDEARVAALARGDVPLQQPAARRAVPDDPLGRALPAPVGAVRRPVAHDRAAVLRLLPARVRPAAAAADGDRAADRLAANARSAASHVFAGRSALRSSPGSC